MLFEYFISKYLEWNFSGDPSVSMLVGSAAFCLEDSKWKCQSALEKLYKDLLYIKCLAKT